ncbi:right-handed parallel beta-helix repeat-containing protein [Nocardioides sp. GXZ039]|uniref:right-handed parallel beta-helix repeat-containing protein n=1 Tax=Nocardioides sp. GXZ039 TaxID=3136018 RepID=UPI0030F406F5
MHPAHHGPDTVRPNPTRSVAALATALLCLGLLAAPTASASPPARAVRPADSGGHASGTLYVSVRGNDHARGTASHPLRTIGAAVSSARPGQRIVVRPGRYHESVEIPSDKPGLSLVAAKRGTVLLDGASPVTGFVRSGSTWVRSGWTTEFDHSPTYTFGEPDSAAEYWQFVNRKHPMAAHPDQVWVDGRRLRQVAGPARVRAGTFYVDDGGDRLIVGSDPGGHRVSASRLIRALEIRADHVTIDGIDVSRFAPSVPHMGAVTAEADGIRILHSRIRDNATTGLHVMASGIVLRDVTLSGNGMLGMTSNGARNLRIVGLRAERNNHERFNYSPAAGGVKLTRSRGITVTRSTFARNFGTGLWFDESAYDISVRRSRFVGNRHHGLRFEISGTAVAARNVVARNGEDGINVNSSDRIRLVRNRITGNTRPINIVQDSRDVDPAGSWRDPTLPLTWRIQHIQVRNNRLTGTGATGSCLLCVEDYSRRWSGRELHITADANLYRRGSDRASDLVYWPGQDGRTLTFAHLAGFRSKTGQEDAGRVAR